MGDRCWTGEAKIASRRALDQLSTDELWGLGLPAVVAAAVWHKSKAWAYNQYLIYSIMADLADSGLEILRNSVSHESQSQITQEEKNSMLKALIC